MEFKKLLEELKNSETFSDWREENPDAFLAHGFMMMDEPNIGEWQIGYFSPDSEKMTTFVVEDDKIEIIPNKEIVDSDKDLEPLEPEKVEIDSESAINIANQSRNAHYSEQKPLKAFFILQSMDGEVIYNVTFFTQSFKTVNFKIRATDGEIIEHSSKPLMEFDQG